MSDSPGQNIGLHPAPQWMKALEGAGLAHSPHAKHAAVLMAISGTGPEDARILLTHRSPSMRTHAGQLAFPGGRADPGDANPVDTALREAWEETRLDRHDVTPIAQWRPRRVRMSTTPVFPIVAHWHNPQPLVPNETETDHVFATAIADLIDSRNRLRVGMAGWTGPAFDVDGYILWGFTAGIVDAALSAAGWEKPWAEHKVYDLRATLKNSRNNEQGR